MVTGTTVLTGIVLGTAAELPPGAVLVEGTGGRAAGAFRGDFLGLAAPWGVLLGDVGRLGYNLLAEVSLREAVKTASGPTAR